ncbi:uncharacterized protein LOC120337675 [Styela clava]
MKVEIKLVATVILGVCFIRATGATSCYTCWKTTNPFFCFPTNCLETTSCFTQAWIEDGYKYYQKGCYPVTTATCDVISDRFCTNTNTFECCDGALCNFDDPLLNWAPKTPSNIMPVVGTNSIVLSWDPVCIGDYTYEVEYAEMIGNVVLSSLYTMAFQNSAVIQSLSPGKSYSIKVRSVWSGLQSLPANIALATHSVTPTAPSDVTTISPMASRCWTTPNYLDAPSTLEVCPNANDFCFSRVEYLANTSVILASRGCMTQSRCKEVEKENKETCLPGSIGKYCHFCCKGIYCNTVAWTSSGLTCENIPVEERLLCGWSGISVETCMQLGCCYLPSNDTTAWCHHGKYPGGDDGGPNVAGLAISVWSIILIVIIILIIILIIVIVTYCCIKRKRERAKGSYDVYAVPKRREDRELRISTVARQVYDRTVIED